jgi:sulfite exporter TauE/SafE
MALFPCGALYATLLIAAGTSSAWRGAAVLTGFAVVSAVGLGASAAISRVAVRVDSHTRRALGAALAIGAIVLVLRPLTSSEPTHAAATCRHESIGP